jgi:hypothetical protein
MFEYNIDIENNEYIMILTWLPTSQCGYITYLCLGCSLHFDEDSAHIGHFVQQLHISPVILSLSAKRNLEHTGLTTEISWPSDT